MHARMHTVHMLTIQKLHAYTYIYMLIHALDDDSCGEDVIDGVDGVDGVDG